MDNILKRRALRLKAGITEGDVPKSGFLSTIYPAMDYGNSNPHIVKTPSSIPSSNDADGEEPKDKPEKTQKEVETPGPSKTTSSSLPTIPGQSAMVPDAHKRAALELGYFGENRSEQFIKRCVELITGVKKLEQEDTTEGSDTDVSDDYNQDHKLKSNGDIFKSNNQPEDKNDHSRLSAISKKFEKSKTNYG
jgi:hypothetical protein